MTQSNMTEEEIIKIIDERLAHHIKQSKYVFDRPIQILDGNDITIASEHGTRIGTSAAQKIAFFGKTPIIQYPTGYLIQPTGGITIDNEARARIQDINYLLAAFGFAYDVT